MKTDYFQLKSTHTTKNDPLQWQLMNCSIFYMLQTQTKLDNTKQVEDYAAQSIMTVYLVVISNK